MSASRAALSRPATFGAAVMDKNIGVFIALCFALGAIIGPALLAGASWVIVVYGALFGFIG